MERSIAVVSRISWGGLEDLLLISRHDLFNSIRIKLMKKCGFRNINISGKIEGKYCYSYP